MHPKDLDVAILQTHMDAAHLQIDIKTVQTNVAKVSSSRLSRKSFIRFNNTQNFSSGCCNLLMDIETVTSDHP